MFPTYWFLHVISNDILPVHRLNDMWTISLQDREHACWEEASLTRVHIIKHRPFITLKRFISTDVFISAFVFIRSIRVVRSPLHAATSLWPYAGIRCLCFPVRVEPRLPTTSFSLSSRATCEQTVSLHTSYTLCSY